MTGGGRTLIGDAPASRALWGLAFIYLLLTLVPGIAGAYGYFIDEFYYVACTRHPAFGYVDHPPLSVWLLGLIRVLFGDALLVLRIGSSLAGAATILVTGHIARRLGADPFGQALAGGALMTAPIFQVLFSFYSMNAIGILFWALAFWILVELERRAEPRLWLLFGVLAGLALLNKHTFALLLLGLFPGLLLSRTRRHLAGRWLWLGGAIALLFLLPNLLWQAAHGWPSIEFYRNADLYKNVPTPPGEVLRQQVLFLNPATLPVWLAGLVFFLAARRGRPLRQFGWIYVTLLVLLLLGQKSRPDRIAGAYTALFAGGGAWLGDLTKDRRARWVRWALPALLILTGLALAPLGLPLLPPSTAAAYGAASGIVPQIERGAGKRTQLPQWLADRLGWKELVEDVARIAATLEPQERPRAVILAPSYGQAGALELFGRGRSLPPVFATQNNYFLWGPPPDGADVAIVIGTFGEENVRALFAEVELAGIHDCDGCTPWRDRMPIWLARGPTIPWHTLWPRLKHYE